MGWFPVLSYRSTHFTIPFIKPGRSFQSPEGVGLEFKKDNFRICKGFRGKLWKKEKLYIQGRTFCCLHSKLVSEVSQSHHFLLISRGGRMINPKFLLLNYILITCQRLSWWYTEVCVSETSGQPVFHFGRHKTKTLYLTLEFSLQFFSRICQRRVQRRKKETRNPISKVKS